MRSLRCAAVLAASMSVSCFAQFLEPDAVALHILDGEGGGFGWAVSPLADIDGDGAGELITSAPNLATANGTRSGRLYIYSGRSGVLLHALDGPAANANLGFSMADAGDVDADGVHDILAGAKGDQGGTSAGNALVYSGASGAVLLAVTGEEVSEGFGHAVAGIGDIDGDGAGDFVVGAPGTDGDLGNNAGRAYVLSGVAGTPIRVHTGAEAMDQLGSGAAGIGDVDGDGVLDYAVSAKRGGPADRGSCLVYSGADGGLIHELLAESTGASFGEFFVGGVGDFDRDGTPDIYVGDYADGRAYVFSGADGSQLFNREGAPGEGLGCGRGAGDVNGDGHADLAVGAYTHDAPNGTGRVYIFSGCDGRVLRTITSDRGSAEQLGFDAVGMGDVDGDGLPEIIGAAGGGNRVYVVRGNPHPIPDFNGDGAVDTRDVIDFLNAWARADPRADFDQDGLVDTRDITAFLNAWVRGC
ncbi:MAG TPA: FG-GAP-like repeat-containing protein [Phycisphaerales bacterium]|nr:FG-GAP-like repeat-containing protein [Phycisphaerales bacterium]